MQNKSKIRLFTHDDLDGVGCGILGKSAYGDNIDVVYCTNGDINSRVHNFIMSGAYKDYDRVYITDISVNAENAKLIDELLADKVVLLDHHPTAMHLNDYRWAFVDTVYPGETIKTSGTELFYRHLNSMNALDWRLPYDKFAAVVRDYDTWRWATQGKTGQPSKDYNDLMYLYGKEDFERMMIDRLKAGTFPELTPTDNHILGIERRKIEDYCKEKLSTLKTANAYGHVCGVVFADQYINDLSHYIMDRNPQLDFVAIINPDGRVSLRTDREDLDLGKEIAGPLGGGGHPKAAGFAFDTDKTLELVKNIFTREDKTQEIVHGDADQPDAISPGNLD